jgi:hypothetical protein
VPLSEDLERAPRLDFAVLAGLRLLF